MIKKMLIWIFESYCRIVLSTYSPVKVSGKENLPDEPYLIYSNHCSHLDYIILSIFSSLGFRKTCVLVAKDYWYDNKIRRWFANVFFNAISVDRNMLFRSESIDEMIENCRAKIDLKGKKRSLIIFPEGKRSQDGKLQSFKTGPAAIASKLNLSVVPAYISGSFWVWPKGRLLMKPGKISLKFGKVIQLNSENQTDSGKISDYKSDTAQLEKILIELKDSFDTETAQKRVNNYQIN